MRMVERNRAHKMEQETWLMTMFKHIHNLGKEGEEGAKNKDLWTGTRQTDSTLR